MTNALIGGIVALSLLVQGDPAKIPSPEAAPYLKLFTVKPSSDAKVQERRIDIARKALLKLQGGSVERGACNMPMIRGDARVDPKSIVPIERDKTDHKIRAVEPSVCWDKER